MGAGLPVIQTLRDLRETGDEITSIEGIFSGTLAYLFNVYDGKTPFSEIVKDAKAKGYTEPDPRDDLSGTDFVRKVIILGREMGLKLEMKDVKVESLIPAGLEKGSIDDFLERLPKYDGEMKKRFDEAARAARCCATSAASPRTARPRSASSELDRTHAFANIALTDNVVRYATRALQQQSAHRAGSGRGSGSHGGRRVRGSAARVLPISERACERTSNGRRRSRRLRRPTSPSASTSSAFRSTRSATRSPSRARRSPAWSSAARPAW